SSDVAINRYSVGVQQSTLIASSSIRLKYVSGLNRPLEINPVAPEASVASNGLNTHFCHPGAAVAHTLSALEMPSQLAATVRKCAYPHACVCTTAFGFPVVPDVYGKKAISSFEGEEKSSDSDAFSLSSSK